MNIPKQAMEAAKEAMREVTPPPGVTKADWLGKHKTWALLAGAIAAAAPHIAAQALREASDAYPLETAYGGAEHAVTWLKQRAETIGAVPVGAASLVQEDE